MAELNEFQSDTHRRVAANLAQPRAAGELANFLAQLDPHVDDRCYTEDGVTEVLKDLEADGLVKKLPASIDDGAKLVSTINGDSAAIDLHKDKAKHLEERADHRRKTPFLSAELWIMTKKCLEKLTGPTPNEPPPLEGEALEAAQEQNRVMAEEQKKLEKELRGK